MWSAVLFVIVTFFEFGVGFGLIAVAVVSFCVFILVFGVGSFSVCGGFVASVFTFLFGVAFSYVRWFRVCVMFERGKCHPIPPSTLPKLCLGAGNTPQ